MTAARTGLASLLKVILDISRLLWLLFSLCIIGYWALDIIDHPTAMRIVLLVPFDIEPVPSMETFGAVGSGTAWIREATGKLYLEVGSRSVALIWLFLVTAYLAGIYVIIQDLRGLFATVTEGNPFCGGNVLRIRRIGIVIVTLELGEALMKFAQSFYLQEQLLMTGVQFRSEIRPHLGILFTGFALLVIAEVFRAGATMREEQALTV